VKGVIVLRAWAQGKERSTVPLTARKWHSWTAATRRAVQTPLILREET
jgi:hypothetical protein